MPSEVHGSELDRSHIKGKLHKIIFILTICNQRGVIIILAAYEKIDLKYYFIIKGVMIESI